MEPEDGLWLRPQLDLEARAEIPRDRLGDRVRSGFTGDMAGMLVDDLRRVLDRLCRAGGDAVGIGGDRTGFHH